MNFGIGVSATHRKRRIWRKIGGFDVAECKNREFSVFPELAKSLEINPERRTQKIREIFSAELIFPEKGCILLEKYDQKLLMGNGK